jgi:hypothetical protein
MALTKTQRKKLRDAGMDDAAMKRLGAILDADDEDDAPKTGGKVTVYEGPEAESVLERIFGKAAASSDDADDADDDADDEDEDDDQDDSPQASVRWFR